MLKKKSEILGRACSNGKTFSKLDRNMKYSLMFNSSDSPTKLRNGTYFRLKGRLETHWKIQDSSGLLGRKLGRPYWNIESILNFNMVDPRSKI